MILASTGQLLLLFYVVAAFTWLLMVPKVLLRFWTVADGNGRLWTYLWLSF